MRFPSFKYAGFKYTSICVMACWLALPARPQAPQEPQPQQKTQRENQTALDRQNCPGDPPGNLELTDCSFTQRRRLTQFVGGSLTDQALVGATFFGAIAQLRGEPPEWKQNLTSFGYQVGTRYAQNLTKGLTVFAISSAMKTDPRHLSYLSDPGTKLTSKAPGFGQRLGHVFVDWATVRRSAEDGRGRRLPNLPLFAGAATSGYVGNLWYPDRLANNSQALQRGVGSLGTALMSSFYTEFSPDINRALGAMFKKGAKKTK